MENRGTEKKGGAMKIKWMIILMMILGATACEGEGGTETGSTFGTKISAAADALVPEVLQSAVSENVSETRAAVDGTAEEWVTYLDANNAYVLTDIFGSPDEAPAVVTKIRVLLEQFGNNMDGFLSRDPDIACEQGELLSEGDSIEIAFYGTISNGTADDRFFDCIATDGVHESDDDEITLYGEDLNGVLRIVTMTDSTNANEEEVETRGDEVQIVSVVSSNYVEVDEDGVTIAYLDLQFTHSSAYSGVDNALETDDDMYFKSRTRITGRVVLDENGEPDVGAGDFTSTKYDSSVDNLDVRNTTITKAVGRGNYGSGEFSLFKVDSNVWTVDELDGTFCIQMPADDSGLPSNTDATNCTAYESAMAWGTAVFPFTISPALSETFDANLFFEGNDADLISDSGDNFVIPTYESSPVTVSDENAGE